MAYTKEQLVSIARQKAIANGIDPDIFVRQIQQESGFNPNATSGAGAQGIAQFMPDTAKGVGLSNPYEPITALDAGAKYLASYYKRYGDYPQALAAYNAGASNVDKYGGVPPFKETQNYVSSILGKNSLVSKALSSNNVASPGSVASLANVGSPTKSVSYEDTKTKSNLPDLLKYRNSFNMFDPNQPSLMDLAQARTYDQEDKPVYNKPSMPLQSDTGAQTAMPAQSVTESQPDAVPLQVKAGKGVKNVENATPVVAEAMRYMGVKYTWGGENPKTGFDCSGFTQYLYAKQGIKLPRVADDQYKATTRISKGDLVGGDLIFFRGSTGGIDHMGLYIGDGNFIHSPKTGDVVKISSLGSDRYMKSFAGGGRPKP